MTAYMVKIDETHDAAVVRYSEFLRNAAKQEQLELREAKLEEDKRVREEQSIEFRLKKAQYET